MNVLWIVNTLPPHIASCFGIESKHAISWVDAMAKRLEISSDLSLGIATTGNDNELHHKLIGSINYYILPKSDVSSDCFDLVLNDFNPDVIHCYGTEERISQNLIDKYKTDIPIIISLQGIITEYVKHYYAGMSEKYIRRNYTIRDILLRDGIFSGRKKFERQIPLEQRMLNSVRYVEGRSDWDRVMSKDINPNLKYYYCPRMIREEFYNHQWNYDSCEKYSILVHQGTYPIKGVHFMIDALARLVKTYPNIKLYIAGNSNIIRDTWKKKLTTPGYAKIIADKISKYNLKNNIIFTGYLNAEAMAEKLSCVNVCVIPSAIENAPNALAEAMVVGTPCVASYVGGNPDMLNEGECGLLYRFDEPAMLADRISVLFDHPDIAKQKSNHARRVALGRHNPDKLVSMLKEIYKEVIIDFKRDN